MNPGDIVAVATGTAGLTVFLMYVVKRLWQIHEADDLDMKAQRDEAIAALRTIGPSIDRLADAVEKLTRASKSRP